MDLFQHRLPVLSGQLLLDLLSFWSLVCRRDHRRKDRFSFLLGHFPWPRFPARNDDVRLRILPPDLIQHSPHHYLILRSRFEVRTQYMSCLICGAHND